MTLSRDVETMVGAYDAIVIGSGYGGAITAARLAIAGRRVCVLERGREWETGTFPDDAAEVAEELRTPDNPLGLFDYHHGDDVDVLVGNGLGGTSLINANVVIAADDATFQRPRWPKGIRDAAARGALQAFGDAFEATLGAAPVPEAAWPAKVTAMQRSAAQKGGTFVPVKLAVNFALEGHNAAGVAQHPCTLCGDCVTGCNVGAKNTLTTNYLPIAHHHGAAIFTGVEVEYLLPANRDDGGYFVWFKDWRDGGARCREPVYAPIVVVSAGSLGSTAILLRSAERGLKLSWRLGHHFSGNADQLGFGYNCDVRTDVLGFGGHDGRRAAISVGPTISSLIRYVGANGEPFIIEDGAVPRAFVDVMRGFGTVLASLDGKDTDGGLRDKLQELGRAARDWVGYDVDGAANHSMVYLGMGHDGADGRLVLDAEGRIKVLWTEIEDRPVFRAISDRMRGCVEALGGTYIRNPRWSELGGENIITVHPLGGCPMGDDAESGVVNEWGEAWDPTVPGGVHPGLFVADGSVIPDSVGVNPLHTIATLAERTAQHIVDRADLPRAASAPPIPLVPAPPLGLEFTEDMEGFVMPTATDAVDVADYVAGYEAGRAGAHRVSFRLTMFIEHLERFIADKAHEARAEGCVDSELHGKGRRVDRGRFNLFVIDEATGARQMRYLLRYTGEDGQSYVLDGHKVVKDDPGIDLWSDNTTLFTRIRRGVDETAPVVAVGVLRIGVAAFVRLLSTFKIRNGTGLSGSARAMSRFGRFFLGDLWETYVTPKMAAR